MRKQKCKCQNPSLSAITRAIKTKMNARTKNAPPCVPLKNLTGKEMQIAKP